MATQQPPGTVETLVTLADGSMLTRTWSTAGYVDAWNYSINNPNALIQAALGRLQNTTVTAGNVVTVLADLLTVLGLKS